MMSFVEATPEFVAAAAGDLARIGTTIVCVVTPASNVSVPETGVKSKPGMAVTATVVKSTVTAPRDPPTRSTTIATEPASSLTAYDDASSWMMPKRSITVTLADAEVVFGLMIDSATWATAVLVIVPVVRDAEVGETTNWKPVMAPLAI